MSKEELKDYAAILLNISSGKQPANNTHRVISVESSSLRLPKPAATRGASSLSSSLVPPIPSEISFKMELESQQCQEDKPNAHADPFQDDSTTKLTDRQRFLLFFKIIVAHMVRTTPELKERIVIHRNLKALVTECREVNNYDDEVGTGMTERLASKLHSYVGEQVWRRSQGCYVAFCRSRKIA